MLSLSFTETEKPALQLQWLRSNSWDDNSELASKYMSETAKYRRNWMMASDGKEERTMGEILAEFPYMLNPGMVSGFLFSVLRNH